MGINIYRTTGSIVAAAFVAGLAHGEYGETKLFENLKFQHSIGLITDEGHGEGSGFEGYANWGIWNQKTGRLETAYDEITSKFGIKMPTYLFLKNDDDERIDPNSIIDPNTVDLGGGVRRPTHVTEHTLYAIPGEKIYLYPYTDFGQAYDGYLENFTRWYDYSTDKKSPYLAFDNEFSDVIETEYGTLGGKSISAVDNTFIIANVEDYMEFVQRVNFGDVNLCAEITAPELDFGPYNKTKDLAIGSKGDGNGTIPVTITYDERQDPESINPVGKPLDPIGFFNKNLSGSNGDVFFTYTGTFNGNGCVIKNLHINRYVEDAWDPKTNVNGFVYNQKLDVGMFGRVGAGARIYGLRIDPSCEFTGQERVGFIGGIYEDSKYDAVYVENVINHGDVTADWKLGWSSGVIEGGEYAGGIFGGTQGSTDIFVRNCAATGNVKGYDGSIIDAAVKDGKVTYSDPAVNVGGLAGFTGYNAMLDKDGNAITDGDPSKLIMSDGSVKQTSITAFKNCYTVATGLGDNFLPIRGNGNLGAIRLFDSYDPTRSDVKDYSINFWMDEEKKIADKYYPYYYKGLYNCYSPVETDGELHKGSALGKDGETDKGYDHFDLENYYIDEEDHSKGMRKMGWYSIPSYTEYPQYLAEKLNNEQETGVWQQRGTHAPIPIFVENVVDKVTKIDSESKYIEFVNEFNKGERGEEEIDHVILTRDLNFQGYTNVEPLGNIDHAFNGIFDGQGHIIKNLKISLPQREYVGMFGYVGNPAKIKNIIIDNTCEFIGNNYVGFIGAIGEQATNTQNKFELEDKFIVISNILNNGTLIGKDNIGGIYGGRKSQTHVIVRDCGTTGLVSSANALSKVGGIVGYSGANSVKDLDPNGSAATWPFITMVVNCYTTAHNKQGRPIPIRGGGNLGGVWVKNTDIQIPDYYSSMIDYTKKETRNVYFFKGLYNCWSAICEQDGEINENNKDYFASNEADKEKAWHYLEVTSNALSIPNDFCDELNRQNPKGFEPVKEYERVVEVNWDEGKDELKLPQPKKTELDNIIHSEKRVVKIASVNDYLEFARRVNEDHETDLDAELTANLDFESVTFPPMIGEYKAHCYSGTFDGKGHTISNLKIDRPGQGVVGMFGWICGGAVIANLTIDESCLIRGMNTVGLAGSLQPSNAADKVRFFNIVMKGTVEGVETITGGISDGEGYDIGGIFGKRGGTNVFVENCASLGTVKGRDVCTGAIAGHTGWNEWNMTVFENCLSTATGNHGEPLPLRANGNLGGQIKLTFEDFRVDENNSAVKYEPVDDPNKPHHYTYQGIINCYSAIGEASSDVSKWYDNLNNATKILVEKRFTEIKYDENKKFVQGVDIFDDNELHALPENMKSTTFAEKLGKEWNYVSTEDTPLPDIHKVRFIPTRQGGAVATFLIPEDKDPKDVFNEKGELYIALDISQTYSQDRNLKWSEEDGCYTLIEPIVAFRHIFTIKDARKFADEYSSTAEANEKYISERRRYVSARAGDDFQIRLEFTVPTLDRTDDESGRKYESLSSRYYKASDGVYKRFGRSRLEAYEIVDGEEVLIPGWDPDNQKDYMFYFDEAYDAPDGEFWRMIACNKDNAKAGKYILKVFARDEKDEDVTIPDGSGQPLQLTEFDITFLSEKEASFIPDDEIYDYDKGQCKFDENGIKYKQTEEYLEKNYDLLAKVDFDQYLDFQKALEGTSEDGTEISTSGLQLSDFFEEAKCRYDEYTKEDPAGLYYFKWPEPWGTSSYGFGYNHRRGHSMYFVTNSAVPTPFHSAAHKRGTKFFDRNYYREYFKDAKKKAEDAKNEVKEEAGETTESQSAPRKVDETKDFGKGYYYYVNAAGDPGTITEFEIDELCPGATLYVSAWIAELTATEEPTTANVIFNFNAIMNDGSSQTLHSYVSGSVAKNKDNDTGKFDVSDISEQRGKWMHVYYQFVPNYGSLDRTKIDHYELQLENNARNSHGADYAVDDVRVYGANLKVSARQNEPYCYTNSTKVQVGINFETLLASMGIMEADAQHGDTREIYYTFLDKEIYDEIYNGDSSDEGTDSEIANVLKEAFESAVLKYEYDGEESGVLPWGKMRFFTKYADNPEKATSIAANAGQVWRDPENDEYDGLVMFHTNPYDNDMEPDKEYFIALYLPTDNTGNVSWSDFEIYGLCARSADFKVVGSTVIVENGTAVPTKDDITCCANQNPYIQVNLNVFDGEEIKTEEEKEAIVDWYDGNKEEFYMECMKDGESLAYILKLFRTLNPAFDGKDWTKVQFGTEGEDQKLTQDMVGYLKGLQEEKKLYLYQNYFLFRHKKEAEDNAIMAIPIDMYDQYRAEYDDAMIICTEPVEIPVRYIEPGINHGFADIDYPEAIDSDVPLRIGLSQLDNVSYGADDNEDASSQSESEKKTLAIPLRGVKPVTEGVTELGICEIRKFEKADEGFEFDPQITLYDTDDPAYDLSEETVVGIVEDMKAILHDDGTDELGKNQDNTLFVTFDKNFKFREGYSYSLQFKYSEKAPVAAIADEAEDSDEQEEPEEAEKDSSSVLEMYENQPPCGGYHVFTMKIVPEYMMWAGGEATIASDDWNSDSNWKRVSTKDLLLLTDEQKETFDTEKNGLGKRFTSDWKENESDEDRVNDRTSSFVPMDFTKVIVPSGEKMPVLYEAIETATVRTWKDGSAADTWKFWPKQVKAIPDTTAPQEDNDTEEDVDTEDLIQYEMAAYYRDVQAKEIRPWNVGEDNIAGIGCRPFYLNSCEEIHFKPESEIGYQRLLHYNKAWVDVETDVHRWHTLSSPLQEVVAGDFYLPTDGARQMTPLFSPIKYVEGINHRFKPAVYQRGWDKATASVYEIGKKYEETDTLRNVALAADWSYVYNDVQETYGTRGTGFSIKTDVSLSENFDEELGKVLFRLPKADTEFHYYTDSFGNENSVDADNKGHQTAIKRESTLVHKLHDVPNPSEGIAHNGVMGYDEFTVTAGGNSNLFLVGNPFMSHMDMAKFLEANSDKIAPKYWIMTDQSQTCAVMDKDSHGFIGKDEDSPEFLFIGKMDKKGYIAPMQGFFVEAKEGVVEALDKYHSSLTLRFSEEMSTVRNDVRGPLKAATREHEEDIFMIDAFNEEGAEESSALVRISPYADPAYDANEDVPLIDNSDERNRARVYTIAGNMAATINQLPDSYTIEVGVMAPEDAVTTLSFRNVDVLPDAVLHDTATGAETPLYEGMTYEVSGPVSSRLFITSGIESVIGEEAIRVSVDGRDVTVTAPEGNGVEISVYDLSGMACDRLASESNVMTFGLDSGVKILEITSGDIKAHRKIYIR